MELNTAVLERFEAGLDPQNLAASALPCRLIGYGEISAIFEIADSPGVAMKRLPIFPDAASARGYVDLYVEYCGLLAEAGLRLPETATAIVAVPERPVVLYIAQALLPQERIGNALIRTWSRPEIERLIEQLVREFIKVWEFTASRQPALEIAIDGQISNWAALGQDDRYELTYIDTSTPFIRRNGRHQIPADLFLQAAPGFIRGVFKRLFLADVLNRYYDPRSILVDLVANLYKEQLPELVPVAIDVVNRAISPEVQPLSIEAVRKYYREDKLIWTLFLSMRRFDRWMKTRLFRKRYEFILPGKIQR